MRRSFAWFWWSYAAVTLTDVFLIVGYLTSFAVDLVALFKIPLALMFLVMVVYHLVHPIELPGITKALILFGLLAAFIGVANGTLFSGPGVTHLYMTLTPVLATSFGFAAARRYSPEAHRTMRSVIRVIFVFSVLVLSVYLFHHYVTKRIAYFGFDSRLPLVGAMLLSQRAIPAYLGAFLLALIAGKRAPLISMLSPAMLFVLPVGKRLTLGWVVTAIALVTLVAAIGVVAYRAGLLYRFDDIVALDVTDYDQFYIATSGRSDELMGLFEHLRAAPYRLLTGSGIGAQYTIHSLFREEIVYPKHYLHVGPLTYLFVFGAPFFLGLLAYVARVAWLNRSLTSNFYYLAMIVTFVGSWFGATIVVEPTFWFFLGFNVFLSRQVQDATGNSHPALQPF